MKQAGVSTPAAGADPGTRKPGHGERTTGAVVRETKTRYVLEINSLCI